MGSLPVSYFDGRTARAHRVTLGLDAGRVTIQGDGIDRDEPLEGVDIADQIGRTPRLVRFHDGAYCEVADLDAFAAILTEQGIARSAVARAERNRGWIAAATVSFVVLLVVAYRFGVPAMADTVATHLPQVALDQIGRHSMDILDRTAFEPSKLPAARQNDIAAAFARLRLANGRPPTQTMVFRDSEGLGANALALPSGVIIVTDGLVTLAKDAREILGVLAHEAGHIERRHGLRQLLQNSTVTLFIAWYVGDVSSLVATAPTLLLQAKYSRDFEREADAYAAEVMRANGISLAHLADILERLENGRSPGRTLKRVTTDYLSSHPTTADRLRMLRGQ
jgi:Zn-dependent protease with chaperone function